MLYVRLCLDKPGSTAQRDEVRAEHRAYLRSGVIKIVQAGPLLAGDDDATNAGSFFIVEAESREQVAHFHDQGPFTLAGLYGQVLIYAWDKHIG